MKQSCLYISDMEARNGCQKFLKLPGQVAPVRINLPPGMKNGQRLVINNAQFYDTGGNIAIIPVSVTIYVQYRRNASATHTGAGKKKRRWIWAIAAIFVLAMIGAVTTPQEKSSEGASNIGQGSLGTLNRSEENSVAPSSEAPSSATVYVDIPHELRYTGWRGLGDHYPRLVFDSDGSFTMRIAKEGELYQISSGEYYEISSTYKVYQYDTGLQIIECELPHDVGDGMERLATSFYLAYYIESEDGARWNFYGEPLGITKEGNQFITVGYNEKTAVLAQKVEIPSFAKYGSTWWDEELRNDLTFSEVLNSNDMAHFSFKVCGVFDYSYQWAVFMPDGCAYSLVHSIASFSDWPDCYAKLTFLDSGVSVQILSAKEGAGWLHDYVGQTLVYNVDLSTLEP